VSGAQGSGLGFGSVGQSGESGGEAPAGIHRSFKPARGGGGASRRWVRCVVLASGAARLRTRR
jgi:hypothetical protein